LFADLDPHAVVLAGHDLVLADRARLADFLAEEVPADQALGGRDRVLGIQDDALLRGVADLDLPAFVEGDHRGDDPFALLVREDRRLPVEHRADARIARSEIDADRDVLAHTLRKTREATSRISSASRPSRLKRLTQSEHGVTSPVPFGGSSCQV